METLVWLRVPGDVVFAIGGVFLAVYALALLWRALRPLAKAAQAAQPRPDATTMRGGIANAVPPLSLMGRKRCD